MYLAEPIFAGVHSTTVIHAHLVLLYSLWSRDGGLNSDPLRKLSRCCKLYHHFPVLDCFYLMFTDPPDDTVRSRGVIKSLDDRRSWNKNKVRTVFLLAK